MGPTILSPCVVIRVGLICLAWPNFIKPTPLISYEIIRVGQSSSAQLCQARNGQACLLLSQPTSTLIKPQKVGGGIKKLRLNSMSHISTKIC